MIRVGTLEALWIGRMHKKTTDWLIAAQFWFSSCNLQAHSTTRSATTSPPTHTHILFNIYFHLIFSNLSVWLTMPWYKYHLACFPYHFIFYSLTLSPTCIFLFMYSLLNTPYTHTNHLSLSHMFLLLFLSFLNVIISDPLNVFILSVSPCSTIHPSLSVSRNLKSRVSMEQW